MSIGVEKIPPAKCLNCNSDTVSNVGFRMVEGFYCDSCGYYTKRNGEVFYVQKIKGGFKNTLFESDLILKKGGEG